MEKTTLCLNQWKNLERYDVGKNKGLNKRVEINNGEFLWSVIKNYLHVASQQFDIFELK
jgi:hypothetical protein